ncbi:MAG: DUF1640 domain-containing protein [Magnetococcales bacterium]|nr:DUF1640 domain-containing protein [Magnetococcales bacterium]NGZ05067.1 DUF1640 domain-containing protein [Magnetococcales bacterium]
MSTAVTFDTLKFVETLKASGVADPQAKAMATAIQEAQQSNLSAQVTKHDLEKELTPIRTDLAVIKWMLALIIIVTVPPALKTLLGG